VNAIPYEERASAALEFEAARAGARFDVVHTNAIRFFPELAESLGGDTPALLRKARIDPDILNRRGSLLEYRALVNLLEIAATELQCPAIGLRLASLQGGTRATGPIGVVMKNSNTLGQALGYCAKHIHAYCLATKVRFQADRPNHKVLVGLEVLVDRVPVKSQVVEHALLLASLNVVDITGGQGRVRQVCFRHAPLSLPSVYRGAFGCEVLFGQSADGLVFEERDLLCPVIDADEQLYEMATTFIADHHPVTTPPLHARVRSLIKRHLGDNDCTNERIAAELCMHPRTLQRRLKCDGMTFESIKDEVRRDVAWHYLQQPDIRLAQIAEKIGYAEQSVLSRSCYRWFSASPRELRERAIAQITGHLEG
jgi:AraC-like DNA-binding protein